MTEHSQNILVIFLLFAGLFFWPVWRIFFRQRLRKIAILKKIFLLQLAGYVLIGATMWFVAIQKQPDWGDLIFFAYWVGQLSIVASLITVIFVGEKNENEKVEQSN